MLPITSTDAIVPLILLFLPSAVFCTIHSNRQALSYNLDVAYTSPSDFLSGWDFYSGSDPTHGSVGLSNASSVKPISALFVAEDSAVAFSLAVDSTTVLDPNGPGRGVVRITSQKAWTHGLFVVDIAHMPAPSCGIWPACKPSLFLLSSFFFLFTSFLLFPLSFRFFLLCSNIDVKSY
jgi:hypothetical protein